MEEQTADKELENLIQWIVEGNANNTHRIEIAIPEEGLIRMKKDNKIVSVSIGRNEPCFCGSGKKYKLCCGR